MDQNDSNGNDALKRKHRQVVVLLLMVAFISLAIISFGRIVYLVLFKMTVDYLQDHFTVIIGLPISAAVSLGIVTLLRQTEGNINFKLCGIKLSGAGGSIVLWVICYLSISFSIWLLWSR